MVYNIDMIRLFGDDIREKLNAFDSIAVAVSGGRDSVALLHFLAHGGFCRKLSVLHVNHRIRGEESEEDRDFYLKRDFYGDESKRGTLYMDSACDRIIYGHNMKDGSMFGELDRYTDREYMRRFPQILLYLIGDDGKIISEKYEMVSSFTISEKKFKTEGFLRMIKGETAKDRYDLWEYLEGVNPVPVSEKINDIREIEFLLLVTCEYSTENGRLFVVAKKIS